MLHATLRWALPLIGLLVFGPLAGWLASGLTAADGGPEATLLLSGSPVAGVVALLVAMAVAGFAVWTARVIGPGAGLLTAGLILAWPAMALGRVDGAIMHAATMGAGASLTRPLVIEGLLTGAAGVGLTVLILRAGALHRTPEGVPAEDAGLWNASAGAALPIALGVGAVVVWLVARDGMKGQTLAAGVLAGMGAAGLGRTLVPTAQAGTFVLAMAVLAVIGPVCGWISHHTPEGMMLAAQSGRLFPLATLTGLDWIAGGLIGVPMGLSWAGSMLQKHGEPVGSGR